MGGAKVYNIYKENGVYKSDLPKWWESDNYFNQLQIIAPRIKRIYMAGGEPMIAPRHGDLLDMLISNGHAERIDLSYDTNLLAINDKILRRLQHFKSVQISVSADDIEDKFTYIRYPSSWKKVQSNMQLLEKYNLRVDRISVVIGIYSLYSMIRMVHYYRDIGFNRFRQRILNSPLMFDMKWLPRQAKIDAIKKYAESDIGEENYKLTIGYLYNNINVPENPIMLKACVDRMDKFDKIRGLNWKNTFPEVADILKDYIT
jgi:MoaA/NifB/PqqE/SkfB family radical SAM enzyme